MRVEECTWVAVRMETICTWRLEPLTVYPIDCAIRRDERHMVLESVLDDRNSKLKQVKDSVVDDVKIAIAAMKKLGDISALSAADTPATIAEKERVNQIRYANRQTHACIHSREGEGASAQLRALGVGS